MPDPHLLDPVRWQALAARLAKLAAARPDLALQCDAIRAPIETLGRMWRDALPALHGDRLAAERIGALTAAAGPVAALVESAHTALARAKASNLAIDHRPGLVRIGELAILAIAAARMAPRTTDDEPSGSTAMYVHVIHGLALQAAPAEVLARVDPHGGPLDVFADLVARLLPRALVNGFAERIQLRRFVYDPVELGRWTCLAGAFGALGYGAARGKRLPADLRAWSPVRADGITSVTRDGERVTLHGQFAWAKRLTNATDPGALAVLGARADGAGGTAVERGRVIAATTKEIIAKLGPEIEWVGYALADPPHTASRAIDLSAARAVRAEVRAQLDAIGTHVCVANPALSAAIFDPLALAALAEAPPRGTANELVAPLRVTGDGDGDGDGNGDGDPPPGPPLTFVVFRPRVLAPTAVGLPGVPADDRVVDAEVARRALDRAAARFCASAEIIELPWVEDPLAVLAGRPGGADDPRVAVLLEQLERGAARTPGLEHAIWIAFIPDRPELDTSGAVVVDRSAPLAVGQPGEAALAVVVASPAGVVAALAEVASTIIAASPATRAALSLAALRRCSTFGMTAAPAGTPLDRGSGTLDAGAAPASSACLLAAGRGPVPRLRLVGTFAGCAIRLVDAPRLDPARAAGPGAPEAIDLVAVCLDGGCHEVARTVIGGHRIGGVVAFAALVAVTEDVTTVELRVQGRAALRIARPSAAPRLAGPLSGRPAPDARFALDWRLTSGSAREVVMEVAAREGIWVPIAELCGCADREVLPLWRLAPGELRARIVATDGWNIDAVELSTDGAWRDARRGPFVLRRLGDHQVWADIPDQAALVWTLPAGVPPPPRHDDRVISLPPRTTGEVAFHAAGIVERVALGASDGYRRH